MRNNRWEHIVENGVSLHISLFEARNTTEPAHEPYAIRTANGETDYIHELGTDVNMKLVDHSLAVCGQNHLHTDTSARCTLRYFVMASDCWFSDYCLSCSCVGSRRCNVRVPSRDLFGH